MSNFQIFSAINQTALIWHLIVPVLTILIGSVILTDIIFSGWVKSQRELSAKAARLNSIPHMSAKELKQLAKEVKLPRYSRMKKYELANSLMELLC